MKSDQKGTGSPTRSNDLSLWSSYCGPPHADKSGSKPTPIHVLARNNFNASCNPEIYIDLHSYDLLYLEKVNKPPHIRSQRVLYLLPSQIIQTNQMTTPTCGISCEKPTIIKYLMISPVRRHKAVVSLQSRSIWPRIHRNTTSK